MSYFGLNTKEDLDAFETVIPKEAYSQEVLKEIKLISFRKTKVKCDPNTEVGAVPFGSYIYRIQKYPGDIDLIEEFTNCGTIESLIKKFIKALRRVITEIKKTKTHYFTEFKAGLNDYFNPKNIGTLTDGFFDENKEKIRRYLENDDEHQFFSSSERAILEKIYRHENPLTEDDYDKGFNALRNHYILRWTEDEIMEGKKRHFGRTNQTITTLQSALSRGFPNNHVKIDMVAYIDGRFIEITNFMMLAIKKDDTYYSINVDPYINDVVKALPREVEKLYFSNYYFSPFKCLKRMFSLTRNMRINGIGNHNEIDRIFTSLIGIISSNISEMYQIKSEIDTISLLLMKLKTPPKTYINKALDHMKLRISKIVQFSDIEVEIMLEIIDEIINLPFSKSTQIEKFDDLTILSSFINKFIKAYSLAYMQQEGLNPPPRILLPEKRTYSWDTIVDPDYSLIKPERYNQLPEKQDFRPRKKWGNLGDLEDILEREYFAKLNKENEEKKEENFYKYLDELMKEGKSIFDDEEVEEVKQKKKKKKKKKSNDTTLDIMSRIRKNMLKDKERKGGERPFLASLYKSDLDKPIKKIIEKGLSRLDTPKDILIEVIKILDKKNTYEKEEIIEKVLKEIDYEYRFGYWSNYLDDDDHERIFGPEEY